MTIEFDVEREGELYNRATQGAHKLTRTRRFPYHSEEAFIDTEAQ